VNDCIPRQVQQYEQRETVTKQLLLRLCGKLDSDRGQKPDSGLLIHHEAWVLRGILVNDRC